MRKLCCHKRALWFSGARGSMSADGARTLSCSRTTPIAGTLFTASSAKFNSLCSAAIVRNLENEHLEPDTEHVKSAECELERILRGAQSSRRFCAHFPPILTFPDPTLPRAPSYTIQFPQSTLFEPNIAGTIVFVRPSSSLSFQTTIISMQSYRMLFCLVPPKKFGVEMINLGIGLVTQGSSTGVT